MRVREWYSWHFPELIKLVSDNVMYARVVKYIQAKETMTKERVPGLTEVVSDENLAKDILEAAKTSMGTEINDIDLINITRFADRVVELARFRKSLHSYLTEKMRTVCPNVSAVVGEMMGARLVAAAGSLLNLAKAPASTVQLLGAEKALFRAIRTKSNTPKYGVLFNSSWLSKAKDKDKGRIARFISNKCSFASRLDAFSEKPTDKFGMKFREQVEERLKFYATGELPRRNYDVMQEVLQEIKRESQSDDNMETDGSNQKTEEVKEEAENNVQEQQESTNEENEMETEYTSPKKTWTKADRGKGGRGGDRGGRGGRGGKDRGRGGRGGDRGGRGGDRGDRGRGRGRGRGW
eukprot:TRINITY_DN7396_c0_g1_i1.p1 TRINITY_DN7396_c0_g1~~TRINITY_DN7396_c0_g1_i1.p1  ORF type:complete len:351 (-),score=84.53 TRINITY_DN7396_c0_g1_i1:23-1075(-)